MGFPLHARDFLEGGPIIRMNAEKYSMPKEATRWTGLLKKECTAAFAHCHPMWVDRVCRPDNISTAKYNRYNIPTSTTNAKNRESLMILTSATASRPE